MRDDVAGPDGSGLSEGLGPLPEPRMWYDHATQRCSGMAPVGGTNERLWDASDMRAYAAAAVQFSRNAQDDAYVCGRNDEREAIAKWLEGQGQPDYAHEVRYRA